MADETPTGAAPTNANAAAGYNLVGQYIRDLSFENPGAPGAEQKARERERRRQEAILAIQRRYGSNAILKGMNLEEGATTRERNKQIGGHRA